MLTKKSREYLIDAYDTTWISSQGKYKDFVEEKFSKILSVEKESLFLCSNGTTAMHLCCLALKLKYPNVKRILVPDNVYVAAWNTFLINPIYDLVPVSANKLTWNIDLNDLENKIQKDDCVLIVHNIGGIINVPELQRKYKDCIFIEDNCEGIFGNYESKMTGTASFCSAFSFFGNKTITSGEGGLFYCKDKNITKEIKKMHGQGMSNTRYIHDVLGFNYRMTNLQAAILLGQLDSIEKIIERKSNIWEKYNKAFKHYSKEIQLQHQEEECKNAQWIYPAMLKNKKAKDLIEFLKENNIDSRPMFYPMSHHKHLKQYSNKKGETNAKYINEKVIMLPSYPDMSELEVEKVISNVVSFITKKG